MNYLSVCSGIEAATVAWHDLGWIPSGFSEIEPFPSAVLQNHYPEVMNFGDMTKYKEWDLDPNRVDLLVGGTPCQSFSVAGLRKGLDDPRGNLALVYCGMLDHFRPRWFVWENVPGVLSSNGGRDFGSFLGAVAELGYGFAYRVLDAQYFGVAQRRRRVFVVGHLGGWQRPAAVLFERESLRRDTAPRREAGENVAGTFKACASSGGWSNSADHAAAGYMQPVTFDRQSSGEYGTAPVAITVAARDYKGPSDLVSYGIAGNIIGRQPQNGGNGEGISEEVSYTLTKTDQHGVAHPITFQETADCLTAAYGTKWNGNASATNGSLFAAHPIAYAFDSLSSNSMKSSNPISGCNQVEVSKTLDTSRGLDPSCNQGGIGVAQPMAFQSSQSGVRLGDTHATLDANNGPRRHNGVMQGMAVRRLTPVECERLQGFPDNYTNIPWRKSSESPDGPRYKALGNSMAVPVMRWIGERINQVDQIK